MLQILPEREEKNLPVAFIKTQDIVKKAAELLHVCCQHTFILVVFIIIAFCIAVHLLCRYLKKNWIRHYALTLHSHVVKLLYLLSRK